MPFLGVLIQIFSFSLPLRLIITESAYALYANVDSITDRRLTELKYRTGLCYYSLMNHDKAIEEFEKAVEYLGKEMEKRKQAIESPEDERVLSDLAELNAEIVQKITDVKETKAMVCQFCFLTFSPKDTCAVFDGFTQNSTNFFVFRFSSVSRSGQI